jgi:hypothetical protein
LWFGLAKWTSFALQFWNILRVTELLIKYSVVGPGPVNFFYDEVFGNIGNFFEQQTLII